MGESKSKPLRIVVGGLAATAAALLVLAAPAAATFPGSNGRILFAVNGPSQPENGFYTMNPDGSDRTQILTEFTNDFTPGAEYSADGERIAFTRFGTPVQLMVMDADGQNVAPLPTPGNSFAPSFFPNGQRIVFVQSLPGDDDEIAAIDLDGQNLVQLTNNSVSDSDPSVSPDGTRIVFTRSVGSQRDVFAMDSDGQNQTPLTTDPEQESSPSYSPDGNQIVFARNSGATIRDIVLMGANGESPTPLTNTTTLSSNPVFSPNGSKIAFQRLVGDTEIFTMDPNGQNQVQVTDNSVVDYQPSWQPVNPPALDLTAAEKQKSARLITVTASSNEDASAAVSGILTVAKPKPKAGASKKKTLDLAPVSVELQPGQPQTLTLEIPKKGRKLLKRALKAGKKGSASITATATDDLGSTAQDSQSVTIKKKKPK